MDASVNAKNTALYNSHANKVVDSAQAAQRREEGDAAPVKKFHNKVKRLLLNQFCPSGGRLLDLACGRGGDLLKWIDCRLSYVRGYDIADGEIEEAKRRYAERFEQIKNSDQMVAAKGLQVEFLHTMDIGNKVWAAGEPYDAVTCMFALHYFFASEQSARMAIEMAANNLKPGGHFFGVLPNGNFVMEAIGQSMKPIKVRFFELVPQWKGAPQPFGSAYNFAISDTVTQGVDDAEGSYEYLVYQSVLVNIAREFDMHPVLDYGGGELEHVVEPAQKRPDGRALFRRFNPKIQGLNPSLALASKINCAFVFRKGNRDAAAAGNKSMEDLKAAAAARVAAQRDAGAQANGAPAPAGANGANAALGLGRDAGGVSSAEFVDGASKGAKRGLDEEEEDRHFGGHDNGQRSAPVEGGTVYKRSSRFKRAR